VRQRRRYLARAHVGPDDATALVRAVRLRVHLVLEIALGGLRGHVNAGARDVEFPAVVDAAQAFLFVAPEEQRGASVGTRVLYEANRAGGCPIGDELLAQELDTHGRAIGRWQLVGADS